MALSHVPWPCPVSHVAHGQEHGLGAGVGPIRLQPEDYTLPDVELVTYR